SLWCPRRPQLQQCGLRLIRVRTSYIHNQGIGVRLNIGRRGHAAALLAKLAVEEIQASSVILRTRQSGESRNDNLPRRQPVGHGIGSIELCCEPIGGPEGNTKPSIAERHRL